MGTLNILLSTEDKRNSIVMNALIHQKNIFSLIASCSLAALDKIYSSTEGLVCVIPEDTADIYLHGTQGPAQEDSRKEHRA